ncbi:hypothetical protein P3T76_003501 [Phytophthora citrophthora]|uniref:C2H2-type domain-containing protein n=1 Tax=Phytophthora citrophthora TaxID=4793 RepID=A0AAD9GVG3_9STRA|nr:hypothetical protein P3T76_003501 [Phytophthora citrophthora]
MLADTGALCSWCRSARWQYKCSTCDPRKEKTLCTHCSRLWHSRGFARTHQLTSHFGETLTFFAWESQQNSADSAALVPFESRSNGVLIEAQVDVSSINGVQEDSDLISAREEDNQEVAQEDNDGHTQEEKEDESFEFNMVDGTAEDEDAMLELSDELIEQVKEISASKIPVENPSVVAQEVSTTDSGTGNKTESNGSQHNNSVLPPASSPVPSAETVSTQVSPESPITTTSPVSEEVPDRISAPASTSLPPSISVAVSTSGPAAHVDTPVAHITEQTTTTATPSKTADLEKLLRWFPTNDQVLVGMLADRIENALSIEDALICTRIGKCEEPACRSVFMHYEHCKRDEMCGDPKCFEIYIIDKHRRACLEKETAATTDDKKFVCPFCIRIRQRRSIGVCAALDYLICDQRRALQSAHNEAARNFCLQSINRWTERKQPLRAETDRLNQLARESGAPVFNFPKYQWHFSDVFIKREPTEVGSNSLAQGSAPSEDIVGDSGFTQDGEASDEQQDRQEESIPGTANFNAGYINQLLRDKQGGDNSETAQREFEEVVDLGYAIVDASFCSPSKARQCLLNCKAILDHLQHHLDLQVCNQPMCRAVEHHFAHLSQCKARDESRSCEYCLLTEERQLIRSVDILEAEQPEAEARVQKIINDMTASVNIQSPHEQEQELIQLEDELEQAESNKQELLEKLDAERTNLRDVRNSLERRGISSSNNQRLPLHFTKMQRSDGPGSNKKRRLAD